MQPRIYAHAVSGFTLCRDIQTFIQELHGTPRSLLAIFLLQRIGQFKKCIQTGTAADYQVPEMPAQGRNEMQGVEAFGQDLIKLQESRGVVPGKEVVDKTETMFIVKDIQIGKDILISDFRTAEGHRLVKYREGIPHRPVSLRRYHMQGLVIDADMLILSYMPQIPDHIPDSNPVKVVCLAP